MMTKTKSPFKFLDAFEKKDNSLFFGRDVEVNALYKMTFETNLILLYGASGTGKTSLVKCGLANKFSDSRWKEIYVTRKQDINESLKQEINQELEILREMEELDDTIQEEEDLIETLDLIYDYTFTPLSLIFDQFEELFTFDVNEEEQEKFFSFIQRLLKRKIACKIFIIMREEFIAKLWDFERVVPTLFDYRYRIEKMRDRKIKEVITKLLEKLADDEKIRVEALGNTVALIHESINTDTAKNELTYLQVYLERLYQEADQISQNQLPLFNLALINKVGEIKDVIGQFIDNMIDQLEVQLGEDKIGLPLQILGELITNNRTKKILSLEQLKTNLKEKYGDILKDKDIQLCITTFQTMRILKP